MSSGYNLPSIFPIFAGIEGRFYTALELPTPWVPGILGQLFNHSLTLAYGGWNGFPQNHCIWFHNGFLTMAGWIYVVEDELAGDHIQMSEAQFMADWYGTLFASPNAGEFTPYT